ncbi:hypothetical protein GCM10011321_14730 [Youhaiella tibetensis]|uniref:DUF2213 domain-containing protein n=1 Tax=Paradevosia tibetensis TaxID=1447062 RepID=A0A5B9DM51_9HYPH|nr:DUF2213 domain-containing protein [Youhaiella tibetensis]QEE20411.1 DUF2213 domain-containing protein [Youhaiella tibetensis]GGF24406.1 hypothetical protein GCM10011321_14730 [Youhaiella tibetensis]
MQFTDAVTVAGKPRRIADGYLVATAKCVRVGIQLYTGDELGKPELPIVRVYRPAEEVFARDSLQSFSHAPITIDHPKEPVTTDNWKELSVGEVSTAARQVDDWVELPLIFKDAAAIAQIEGGKRELSAGYVADFDFTPGTTPSGEPYDAVQRSIRINHLALVDEARAGSQARVGDSAKTWGAAPITLPKADERKSDMSDNLRTVVVDGLSVMTTDQGALAIDKLQKAVADAQTKLTNAETAHKTALDAKDTEIGALKADLKKAQDAAGVDVSKLVADRVALEAQVRAIDSGIDPVGKSDDDLRKATVAAKLGDEMVKDAAPAEIAGMFKALTKDAKPNDAVRDALRTQDHSILTNDAWGDNVFANAGVGMKKGA